ncbi:hypothetical protein MJO28_014348 [Puccinia striiformis f. sp. tritici]|uniref:Uncharacterized protein n=1 Tax=Puccinia striiformis f. sp. tritici TaxID=168172 RepID=A0ACC0DV99_9BASI|nr:hypothetical protein MJO28_014348 [Puccinia striiformis f. sp. tritici]
MKCSRSPSGLVIIQKHSMPRAQLEPGTTKRSAEQQKLHEEILALQDEEISFNDQTNELARFLQDNNDNGDEDDEEITMCQSLWPIAALREEVVGRKKRRKNPGGGILKGYRLPVVNPSNPSGKLISRQLSRSSRFNHRQTKLKAEGSNNNIMANFMAEGLKTGLTITQRRSDEDDEIEEISDPTERPRLIVAAETSEELAQRDARINAHKECQQLNQILVDLHKFYRQKCKKEPKFVFPASQLDELQEFNTCRLKLFLAGHPAPNLEASTLSSQASNFRLPTSQQTQTSSGVSRAKRIRKQAQHVLIHKELYFSQAGKGAAHPSLLDDNKIHTSVYKWSVKQQPGQASPRSFQLQVNNVILPELGCNKTISEVTATNWMLKLGFRPQTYAKCIYFDGHERPDVIKSGVKYLSDVSQLRKYSQTYGGDDLETAIQIDPVLLEDHKQTVFVYHDESTVHANERPKSTWLLPGCQDFRSKSLGRLIHISDFIVETTGRLELSDDQFNRLTEDPQAQVKPSSRDAATVIYPGAKGDAWWDMPQLCDQIVNKALPIFEALHPDCQGVFIFDCSSAHGAYSPSALQAQNMNLSSGGKQGLLRDTVIPSDDPNIPLELRGKTQTMIFPADPNDPSSIPRAKGIQVVLQERGLWDFYEKRQIELKLPALNLKCATCRLPAKKRDAAKRTAVLIEAACAEGNHRGGWPCMSFPAKVSLRAQSYRAVLVLHKARYAFFCSAHSCSDIGFANIVTVFPAAFRSKSHECSGFPAAKDLFEECRKLCPLSTIQKYFRRIDRQLSAYEQGLTGAKAEKMMRKCSSHRRIPKNAMKDLDENNT